LEVDIVAKYVEKMMRGTARERALGVEELVRKGF
jgi:hypothetical protein